MKKWMGYAARGLLLAGAVGTAAVFQADNDIANAGSVGGGYYEECNVDFHNSGGITEWDIACSTEEVKELYHPGSYKEECWGEGCSLEERVELSEGRNDRDRVHDLMLNHFCMVRSSPEGSRHGLTFVKGVAQQHFRGSWTDAVAENGGVGNLTCWTLEDLGGMGACTFWNQTFGMILPMC